MPDRSSIRDTLLRFLEEDTSAPVSAIDDSTDLRGGLNLDSVDFVGLVMRIEGHYRIRLSREELEALVTVGDLLTLVEAKIVAPQSAAAAA
jgi:acyl carrier protein